MKQFWLWMKGVRRPAYSYLIGFFATLEVCKSMLSRWEGVNMSESIALWCSPFLLLLIAFFPPGQFDLVRWGGGAALATLCVAEGYERNFIFLTGERLSVVLSIGFFWQTAVIVSVVAIRMRHSYLGEKRARG